MDTAFKKKIEERMEELPKALANAIRSSNWEKIVFDIGRKHDMHVDDIGELQNELILVLVGIVHPDEFRSIVINEIGVRSDDADDIIEEINREINEQIKNQLKLELAKEEESLTDDDVSEMKKAGVSLGEEEEDETSDQIKEEVTDASVVPDTKTASVVAPIKQEEPAKSAPQSAVFKTKVSSIDASDKPRNFLDPYREPLE